METYELKFDRTKRKRNLKRKTDLEKDYPYSYCQVYEWEEDQRSRSMSGPSYNGKASENNVLHLFDCGGHSHYVLLNTRSFTLKSFYPVFFNASLYDDHEDRYHQLIGCHIEMVLGKDPEACILLVGSRWDEVESHETLLLKQKEVDKLFQTAQEHISDRIKSIKDSANLPTKSKLKMPKLICCPQTKIFHLSNAKDPHNQKGLSTTQKKLKDVFDSITSSEDVISFEASAPRFWAALMEKLETLDGSWVEYSDIKKIFENLKKSRNLPLNGQELIAVENEELTVIRLLTHQVEESIKWGEDDSANGTSTQSALSTSTSTQNTDDSEMEADEHTPLNRDEEAKVLPEQIQKIDREKIENEITTNENDEEKWDFDLNAALRYLSVTGDVVWFPPEYFSDSSEIWKYIFHKKSIFFRSLQNLFDHDLKRNLKKFKDEKNEDLTDTLDDINNGFITKSTFDKLFKKKFIRVIRRWNIDDVLEGDIICELLIALKVVAKSNGHGKLRFLVPSLINNPIVNFTKGKSIEEIFNQFQEHIQYTFIFGEDYCFLSSGAIEAFAVEISNKGLFHDSAQSNSTDMDMTFYRQDIESRTPGVVFCIECFPLDERGIRKKGGEKITIIEEERLREDKKSSGRKYYKDRFIHIIFRPHSKANEFINKLESSMKTALRNIQKNDSHMSFPENSGGLRCQQKECILRGILRKTEPGRSEGTSWECNENSDHVMSEEAMLSPSFHEHQKYIIRRYSSLVRCNSMSCIKLNIINLKTPSNNNFEFYQIFFISAWIKLREILTTACTNKLLMGLCKGWIQCHHLSNQGHDDQKCVGIFYFMVSWYLGLIWNVYTGHCLLQCFFKHDKGR